METKLLYRDGSWKAISSCPQYDLGAREFVALKRFLPHASNYTPPALDVLHLASATGSEVCAIVSGIPGIRSYLLNDIVPEVVERSCQELRSQFWQGLLGPSFLSGVADIELSGSITELRQRLFRPALIVLVGNGVVFANRQMDSNIHQAMAKNDLFLLTVEEPHNRMFGSYLIPPVYEMLSQSGCEVNGGNIQTWYDSRTAELHMACKGEDLLISYKPTAKQLYRRMIESGFKEVVAARYEDLHMLAGLYRRADV